jgi:hypothetical protein
VLEEPERTTDHGQATGKLYHLRLRVECTFFVIYKAMNRSSSNTNTGRHDIAEILLKVALKHQKYKIQQSVMFLGAAVVIAW